MSRLAFLNSKQLTQGETILQTCPNPGCVSFPLADRRIEVECRNIILGSKQKPYCSEEKPWGKKHVWIAAKLTLAFSVLFLCNCMTAFKKYGEGAIQSGICSSSFNVFKNILSLLGTSSANCSSAWKKFQLFWLRELLLTSFQRSLPKDFATSLLCVEQPNRPTISQVWYSDSYPPPPLVSVGKPKQDIEELQHLGKGPY